MLQSHSIFFKKKCDKCVTQGCIFWVGLKYECVVYYLNSHQRAASHIPVLQSPLCSGGRGGGWSGSALGLGGGRRGDCWWFGGSCQLNHPEWGLIPPSAASQAFLPDPPLTPQSPLIAVTIVILCVPLPSAIHRPNAPPTPQCTRTHTHKRVCTHTHTHQTHGNTCIHTVTHTRSHTHTHTHTRTHTHTHTHVHHLSPATHCLSWFLHDFLNGGWGIATMRGPPVKHLG